MLLFGLEDLEYSSLEELTKLVKMYDLMKTKKKFFWFLQYWMGQAAWVVFTAGASI